MASMANDSPPIEVFYTPEFKRNLRQLAKKYRHIKSDLRSFFEDIARGRTPGTQVSRIGFEVFKARVKNSDASKGKAGGYRIIYQRLPDQHQIVLITLYSKTEQADITPNEIRRIISEFALAVAPGTSDR